MTVGEENETNLEVVHDAVTAPPAQVTVAPWAEAGAPDPVGGAEPPPVADAAVEPEPAAVEPVAAAVAEAPVPEGAVASATSDTPPASAEAEAPRPAARPASSPAPRAPRPAKPGPMKWYVVQVYSGYEQKVKASLLERIKQAGMEAHFGEILIPTETVQDLQGRRKIASRTFYPGYIFVQMSLGDEVWHVVRDTPKVTGFVGGRNPQPVPAPEIQSVVQQVEEGAAKPRPRVVFAAGDHVRVNDGAFANFTGTVEQVNPDKQKVRVLVSIFGRATPVELDYTQVEKTA
jgi:transcriptional antiterminator NusG